MENNLPINFTNLILALQSLSLGLQKYNLRQANIDGLTPFKILQLYRTVGKKFYVNRTKIVQGSWFQNQLRIYIWLLVGYLFIHKKHIEQMENQDWTYFSSIFHQRPPISFQFQALSLLPNQKFRKWQAEQAQALKGIIRLMLNNSRQKKFEYKWNLVARQLFIRTQKQFYRNQKQCREKWLNFLDPSKKKTGWETHEDFLLLKTILQTGKKWSTVVKILKGTRTEHMVKNRYKSMVSNQMRRQNKPSQNEALLYLIKELQKQVSWRVQFNSIRCLSKDNYHQSLTYSQTQGFKGKMSPKTSSDYIYATSSYVCGNSQFNMPNSLFEGIKAIESISPRIKAHPLNQLNDENQINYPQQNQFFMCDKQLQSYMLFDDKQEGSWMKQEQLQQKQIQLNEGNQQIENKQRINYFSEQSNHCSH